MKLKKINQSNLSAECLTIQFKGPTACEHCDFRDTDDCGGKNIRDTGKNEKGFTVGQEGLEDDNIKKKEIL